MNLAFVLALLPLTGAPAMAPQAPAATSTATTDARWAPWLGCWRLEDDLPGAGLRVCITPDTAGGGAPGVLWQTLVGSQRGSSDLVVADGVSRAIDDAGCTGSARAEWSSNQQRLYRFADVSCGAEGARTLATLAFLGPRQTLVSVQSVDTGTTKSVRVQHYRRAADQTLADGSSVTLPAGHSMAFAAPSDAPWSIADVVEASQKLPAPAVQAALTATRGPFSLNKHSLITLDEAGVDEGVIDLMVAMTYPKRLVIDHPGSGGYAAPVGIGMGGLYDPFYSPILPASYFFADCYSAFDYGYMGYYSPCQPFYSGYGRYYSRYDGYYVPYGGGGGWFVVDPGRSSATPPAEGLVVKGRGYTQVRPREPEPVITGARQRSGSANSDGGSSGSSGGTATSGGYSSGSSGGSSGRTAVPRPPG